MKLITEMFAALGLSAALAAGAAPLGGGEVTVAEAPGGVRIHTFATGDALGDYVSLVESKDALLAFESPAFRKDFPVWSGYARSLGKPLRAVVLSNHAASGGKWFGEAEVLTTREAAQAMSSGATKAIAEGLAKAFGPQFAADPAPATGMLETGENVVSGIGIEVIPDGAGFIAALPKQRVAFMHMLGADTHSIIGGPAHARALLAELEQLESMGVERIFTAHHAPEGGEALRVKAAYVKRVAEIASESPDAAAFKAAVKRAYPGLKGENYLDMTAAGFFPEKK